MYSTHLYDNEAYSKNSSTTNIPEDALRASVKGDNYNYTILSSWAPMMAWKDGIGYLEQGPEMGRCMYSCSMFIESLELFNERCESFLEKTDT